MVFCFEAEVPFSCPSGTQQTAAMAGNKQHKAKAEKSADFHNADSTIQQMMSNETAKGG